MAGLRVITERSDGSRDTQEFASFAMCHDEHGPFLVICEVAKPSIQLPLSSEKTTERVSLDVYQMLQTFQEGETETLNFDGDEAADAHRTNSIINNRAHYPSNLFGRIYTTEIEYNRDGAGGVNLKIKRLT